MLRTVKPPIQRSQSDVHKRFFSEEATCCMILMHVDWAIPLARKSECSALLSVGGWMDGWDRQVNEIYERYVPSSWTKPTPDADQHQREQWILAKYKHR